MRVDTLSDGRRVYHFRGQEEFERALVISLELKIFASKRTRRERQWQRLHGPIPWLFLDESPTREAGNVFAAYHFGHVDCDPVWRLRCFNRITRDRRKAGK